jgi:hypothetical protein
MQYYYLMPLGYFQKHYGPYLSNLVFHREHTNGKNKVIKVPSKKYRGWLLDHLRNYPCPEIKELPEAEALANLIPLQAD